MGCNCKPLIILVGSFERLHLDTEKAKIHLPSFSLNEVTVSHSLSVKIDSLSVANTGFGKYHSMRDVNPFALLEASSITGNAVYGWVNPMKLNDVLCILKFALPVTVDVN